MNIFFCFTDSDFYVPDFFFVNPDLFTGNESNDVTVHGYFNLDAEKKTQLDFSEKYKDKTKMKWIRFICFEPGSPQKRAWFIPIKGLAFGQPRHLQPRNQKEKSDCHSGVTNCLSNAFRFKKKKEEKVMIRNLGLHDISTLEWEKNPRLQAKTNQL